MAFRSTLATFVPMLQYAARQFDPDEGGVYCRMMDRHQELYRSIETRLKEYHNL